MGVVGGPVVFCVAVVVVIIGTPMTIGALEIMGAFVMVGALVFVTIGAFVIDVAPVVVIGCVGECRTLMVGALSLFTVITLGTEPFSLDTTLRSALLILPGRWSVDWLLNLEVKMSADEWFPRRLRLFINVVL